MLINVAQLSIDEALSSLGSSRDGLADQEVARLYAEFGPNRVQAVARQPLWLSLLKEFMN